MNKTVPSKSRTAMSENTTSHVLCSCSIPDPAISNISSFPLDMVFSALSKRWQAALVTLLLRSASVALVGCFFVEVFNFFSRTPYLAMSNVEERIGV